MFNNQHIFSGRNLLINLSLTNALLMSSVSLLISTNNLFSLEGLYRVVGLVILFTCINLSLSAALTLLTWLYRPAFKIITLLIFSTAQLIVIANLQIYSLYHFHINGMVINFLISGALFENIAFSPVMWLSVIGIFVISFSIQWIIYRVIETKSRLFHFKKTHFFLIFFLFLLTFIVFNGYANAKGWNVVREQNRYIPWLPPITMRKKLKKLGVEINQSTQTDVISYSGLKYPLAPLQCSQEKPLNLLFIVVDSLRFDMIKPEIMPYTEQLKSHALSFENHFSGSNSTRYGMFTLFYGLPGNYWFPMLNGERGSVLFDKTIENNYQHFIYGSTRLTFPEFDRTFFSRLRDQLHRGSKTNSAANDADITQKIIHNIKNRDTHRPFLGFVFYDSPHAFSLPKDYPVVFSPRLKQVNYLALNKNYDPTKFLNLYKSTAHYVDSLIKKLMDTIEKQQLLGNTIIIITGDHGQEFNETQQNYWGHNGNFSQWQTKVPFLLLWPDKSPTVFKHITSHEDMVPTLMRELMGCTNPETDYSTGVSLFDTHQSNRSLIMESWTDRAILHNDHLFLINNLGRGKVLDLDYRPVDNLELSGKVLQDNLDKMSRFLKH